MSSNISEEKKKDINARIDALYELCGNISPVVYSINGLLSQFETVNEADFTTFEERLTRTEEKFKLYYNKEGVSKSVAESDAYDHLIVYEVKDEKELEGRYFYNIELANLFIRGLTKKVLDIRYHLSKIFQGHSVSVKSPIFFS